MSIFEKDTRNVSLLISEGNCLQQKENYGTTSWYRYYILNLFYKLIRKLMNWHIFVLIAAL